MTATAETPSIPAPRGAEYAAAVIAQVVAAGQVAFNPDQAAVLLGFEGGKSGKEGADRVRSLCRKGTIPARNLYPGSRNGRWMITIDGLLAFLAESNSAQAAS